MSENNGNQSVTALSENPHYLYQYSSIRDAIHHLSTNSQEAKGLEQELLGLISEGVIPNIESFILLNSDITSVFREHSPTLEEREVVYRPNVSIKGNKPVGIGHHVSCIGYNVSLENNSITDASSSWNIPLSLRRVGLSENKNAFTATQVKEVLECLGTKDLVVNCLDSNYHSPEYIAATADVSNLVNIIRISSSRNVWESAVSENVKKQQETRGAKAVYGRGYKLSEVVHWDCEPIETVFTPFTQKNGKEVIVKIQSWDNRKIRSKRGISMKKHAARLIRIEMFDNDNKPLHHHSLWLTVWGKRKEELSLKNIFLAYRKRFDIEHFFRFAKQRLLLNSYQTPDLQHSENWLKIVQLSYWVLWIAESELRAEKLKIPKWQKYLTTEKQRIKEQGVLSPTKVQNNIGIIFSTFDTTPCLPKVSKNKTGRKLNEKQLKRKRYPVNFKTRRKKIKENPP